MSLKSKPPFKMLGLPYEAAVALAYLFFAVLWIFFSDRTLAAIVGDPQQFISISLYKGWLYVVITAMLLYAVLHRIFRHVRLAQQRLSESEARYRLLIENQTDLVIKFDPEGRFLFASPSCCKLFGKTENQLLGHTFMPLIHEADRPATETAIKALLKPPYKVHMEQRALTKSGLRWLEWQATGIVGDNGNVDACIGIGRDITERKQMDDALRVSEARLVEAQHIAHVGRWDLDLVTNRLEWSDEIYEQIELSRADYEPSYETLFTFVHPDDRELLDETFQRAREKKTLYELEHRMLMPDGRIKWIRELGKFDYDDLGKPYRAYGTAQDITERKLMERELTKRDKLLRKSQEIAHVGSWELDTVKQVLSWSDEAYRIFGVSPRTFTVSYGDFLQIVHPDDRGKVDEAYLRSLQDGSEGYEIEHRIVHQKTGEIRFIHEKCEHIRDAAGFVLYSIGMSQDITERKRVEEDRERLVTAIEQLSETVVITDAFGTIEYVNASFEKTTGYTREEAIGQNPRILKSGKQDPDVYQRLWETISNGKNWEGRFINKRKDGSFYTEDVAISPVRDTTGRIVNYVAIKTDMTVELAREEQYRQIQKMESIGRLAGGVAHDFNNILQTITGFCGLLLAEMDGQSPQRQDVVEIQKAAALAGDLTQQLLTFSRKQPTEYKVLDLNAVLSSGEKMLQQALGENLRLKFDLEPELNRINADASQMLQIALNLAVNARDAMSDGGTVTICTENVDISPDNLPDVPFSRTGRFVCLSISDTGCGMDEQQLAHLFEPFYTTKPQGKGTGLGLSVVYGIVQEHRGWIWVSSKREQGTVFRVYFPVYEAAHGVSSDAEDLAENKLSSRNRILLVADDPVVRQLTGEILQDVGYVVSSVENAGEAEEVFALKNGAFDLLFSDIVLPDRSGIELAEWCLRQHPGLPVLLFSDDSAGHPNVLALATQGFHHMQKPFNFKKLLDMVDLAITRR